MLHYDHANCRLSTTIYFTNEFFSQLFITLCTTLVSLFAVNGKSYFRGIQGYVINNMTIVLKLVRAEGIRNQTSDSNFVRPSFQLSVFMNLLTVYRTAKKPVGACDRTKNEKAERVRGKKRIDVPIFRRIQRDYITYSNGQLHACCVTTPTPVTSEIHRGFPCGRARMRVQNTLHRVAKKGGGWLAGGGGGARGLTKGDGRGRREQGETDWLRICMPKPFLLIGGGGGGGGGNSSDGGGIGLSAFS